MASYSLEEYKQKNEEYQKIIEKQKVTIKTLRHSIAHLVNENELLVKRNKELEYEHSAAIKLTPVLPPRSPFRTTRDKPQSQKRPPVLNLVKSNHTLDTVDRMKNGHPFLQDKDNHLSSPTSTSTSSSIESDNFDLASPKHHESIDNIQQRPRPSKSEPSTPSLPRTPRIDSLPQFDEYNSSKIQIKIIHYDIDRHKKFSLNDYHFLIGVIHKESSEELWGVKKSFNDLIQLDAKLKDMNPTVSLKQLPDKSLFSSSSPSKINERKNMIEEYLQHAVSLSSIENQPLYEFLNTNKVSESSRNTNLNIVKQGYLGKKKRNFGGWKTRYFILDHHGSFNYYENRNGPFLGSINLSTCQIISDTQSESDQDCHYKHTFLLLEQKTSTTFTKHSFSANSHEDKQSWIRHIQSINDMSFFTSPHSSTRRRRRSHHQKPVIETTHFTHERPTGRRRKSSTAIPNPSFHSDDSLKTITKYKNNRKSFWPMKMFHGASPQSSDHHSSDLEESENQLFGIPIDEAISKSSTFDLPSIVYRCIVYIEAKQGLDEEGIYRQSGSTVEVKALKKKFNDHGDVELLDEFHDIHAVVGLLKMWLRELPENILTEAIVGDLRKNTDHIDKQTMLIELGNLVSSLPLANYTLLRFLCAHLIRVIENSDKNKMNLKNISIIFSATLHIPSHVFNMLLLEFDYIFWTNRCDDNQITEKALKMYMDSVEDLSLEARSSRNSVQYQEKTPQEFMAVERQLQGAADDEPVSDEELEVAYYASRYNANSKTKILL